MATIIDGSLTPRGEVKSFPNGTEWYQSNITSGNFRRLYNADGLWVAGSSSTGLYYSTNGKSWTQSNITSANGGFSAVSAANGIWVAASSSNKGLYCSTNGKVWAQSNITSGSFECVFNANGLWVAGSSLRAGFYYSVDGKTWTRSNITSVQMLSLCNANGLWVAGSGTAGIYYSIDGKSWTQSTVTSGACYSVYYNNGLWVAGTTSRGLSYSTDGKNWTSSNVSSMYIRLVYADNGFWVAAESDGGLYYSTDGKTWGFSNIPAISINAVHYANGIWVAGADDSTGLYYSVGGKTWTLISDNVGANSLHNANGMWVAATNNGLYYSPTWEAPPPADIKPGNYQFNTKLTAVPFAKDTDVSVNFKCFFGGGNNPQYVDYTAIHFGTGSLSSYIDYQLLGDTPVNGVYTWDYDGDIWNTWRDFAYRTITLTTPIKYEDNPEFYNWFVENTYPLSKVIPTGTYLLKGNNEIDVKGYNNKDLDGILKFKSNNSTYSRMIVLYTPNALTYVGGANTIVCSSSTWQNQNYRIIKTFYDQPVTDDLYNWFMANVETPSDISGYWTFAETPIVQDGKTFNVSFISNGSSYSSMVLADVGEYSLSYDSTGVLGQETVSWENDSYRVVNITAPVKFVDNPEFYVWFTNNATQGGVVNYLLNDSVFVSADTSQASYKTVPFQYCYPNFISISYRYSGRDYSSLKVSAELVQIADGHYSTSGTQTWDCNSYTYFYLYHDDTRWLSGSNYNTYYGMSSTSMYPDYPKNMYMNTKGIILSFDTAPTGSFLTWLNSNATLLT